MPSAFDSPLRRLCSHYNRIGPVYTASTVL